MRRAALSALLWQLPTYGCRDTVLDRFILVQRHYRVIALPWAPPAGEGLPCIGPS